MPVKITPARAGQPIRAVRRAPWWTALAAAIAVGGAVLVVDLLNPATPWRADLREAWSLGLLVLFVGGGVGSLVAAPDGRDVADLARAWARRHPLAFGLAVGLCCGAAVLLSDLNLWHVPARPASVHGAILGALTTLIGPLHLLGDDGGPPGAEVPDGDRPAPAN